MSVFSRAEHIIIDLRKTAVNTIFSSPIYNLSISGRSPKSLKCTPPPIWPGDRTKGEQILFGKFNFDANGFIKTVDPWSAEHQDSQLMQHLHSFRWLRDLASIHDLNTARERFQTLAKDWIKLNDQCSDISWDANTMGERVSIWLEYYDILIATGGDAFRSLIIRSLSRQLIHLNRIWKRAPSGLDRLHALKGLIFGAVCFPNREKRLTVLIQNLVSEITKQVLEDGGHIERSPSAHHTAMRLLIEIREALRLSQTENLKPLQNAIDRMAPVLRFYRHQDGRLCNFNGSFQENAKKIDTTLIKSDARGRAPRRLPQTGFERLLSGRQLIIVDTGAQPPIGFDTHAHAGTLSFEFSIGQERLITNCGAMSPSNKVWEMVQRTTAAHSTLSINDRNSCELLPKGGLGQRRPNVSCKRSDNENFFKFIARHDGYHSISGITHIREIKLSKKTEMLMGLDRLEGNDTRTYNIRFHLHPDVSVSIGKGGDSALLKLRRGGGWRLTGKNRQLRLDESVYLEECKPRRSVQIVIEGLTQPGSTMIEWSLSPIA